MMDDKTPTFDENAANLKEMGVEVLRLQKIAEHHSESFIAYMLSMVLLDINEKLAVRPERTALVS